MEVLELQYKELRLTKLNLFIEKLESAHGFMPEELRMVFINRYQEERDKIKKEITRMLNVNMSQGNVTV